MGLSTTQSVVLSLATRVHLPERHQLDSKPTPTPIVPSHDSEDRGDLLPASGQRSINRYQSLVGSLLWIHRCTRPDNGFAVHRLTRRVHDLAIGTRPSVLFATCSAPATSSSFTSDPNSRKPRVSAYSDADWATNKEDRKSVDGVVVQVNKNIIAWLSRKQGTEAEFHAAATAIQELVWLQSIVEWPKQVQAK